MGAQHSGKRSEHTTFIPLDQRDPATVRVAILARSSDTSAKPEDMEGQVRQCEEFVAEMGWPPARYVFTEAKSGIRNVERPIIDQLLALCKRGEVDVIVAREFQRVDRTKVRRYQIVQTAADFGVEFRYANLASEGGKMADTWEWRLIRDVVEELGEIERNTTVERLGAAKRRRFEDGQSGRWAERTVVRLCARGAAHRARWQAIGAALVGSGRAGGGDRPLALRHSGGDPHRGVVVSRVGADVDAAWCANSKWARALDRTTGVQHSPLAQVRGARSYTALQDGVR
jgi:DNA invertase Pin-like site-specific DNA recombinase